MVVTRIGVGTLLDGTGSIELPEEVTLFCPGCGTKVADKGQCLANIVKVPDEKSITGMVVKLEVDCRMCGFAGEHPAINI